ncbi:hypothetical protein K493DRAFT_371364 [Basidiobolus meristosporus CBS 931.73]|uniref:Sequence orphan n=1 Tax=Basidiobolus meristosporus CBS 931.73 TaxID=1314790 RepID=A0A1Y1YDU5_9FUNG|nr:hypothetical protein K493DRAFT_371364 [Basidiobolus meristosporus CBS 931.73]|eukprot:ORX96138.1 hypothetical protein K493DRAFT_371364 [Basidiobolus meristosporus CBS 931.73]
MLPFHIAYHGLWLILGLLSIVVELHAEGQFCLDQLNPLYDGVKLVKECGMVNANSVQNAKRLFSTSNSASAPMVLSFYCTSHTEKCEKVKDSFNKAFELITNVITLRHPLTVNASFISFCKELTIGCNEFGVVGAANPARMLPHQGLDGKVRMYPQALLKQKGLRIHPEYNKDDIIALFNSDINFWFEDDEKPINSTQNDFLFAVIHEMMHGFGVNTDWMDHFNSPASILTPMPLFNQTEDGLIFSGFFESAFDQYLIEFPSLEPLSSHTQALNQATKPGTFYLNEEDFLAALTNSTVYKLVERMKRLAVTRDSIVFLAKHKQKQKDEHIFLETSLKPFIPGSLITHFDYQTYTNTSDFLMRFTQMYGESLLHDIRLGGDYLTGPIGPKLTSLLETLGYEINLNPRPYTDFLRIY